MPKEIKKLAEQFLSNPKQVSVAPAASPAEKVDQKLIWTDGNSKEGVLCKLLDKKDVKDSLYFL